MTIHSDSFLEEISHDSEPWFRWRAANLSGADPSEPPRSPAQDELGGFIGPSGKPSPGSTGEGLCHLALLGASGSGSATIAADWLIEARTPAGAWLDSPHEVPGELEDNAGGRVWATAAAATGLLVTGIDPGDRCFLLLRSDQDQTGAFTGGAYPTFAGAAAFWLREGPRTETAEWALRWSREGEQPWWGAWEFATALTLWAAADIGPDHLSVETFLERLRAITPSDGWPDDVGLTLRVLELFDHYGVAL